MVRRSRFFRPPHCPNPACDFHLDAAGWRYKRAGFYTRRAFPRRIQRYRCSRCHRSFSSQTFSPTYWLRRPDVFHTLWDRLLSGSCLRQMARTLSVSPTTLMRQTTRLGRHALLFLQAHRPRLAEPLVVDGFESFAFSQDYPLHVNLAVGADSHFLYAFTDSELRRKGRMTERQRRRRSDRERRFGRADPRAVERGMAELLRLVVPDPGRVTIRSDEHRAYPRAFAQSAPGRIHHERTSSVAARTTGNPLFPVNRVDLLIRHSGAHHKRETIAYSKRHQALMERMAIFAVWLNFQKSFSEKRQDATPAERLGVARHKLSTREILAQRLFSSRIKLPPVWRRYYQRRVPTRPLGLPAPHALSYAY